MVAQPDVARVARTIGDPSRLRMLTLLMDGRALTAKELAYGAGIEPATGSAHLRRLVTDGLVCVRTQGRHRYFRLASPEVARCVESLLVVAPGVRPVPSTAPDPLREARYCYDHLAGRLAVAVTEALLAQGALARDGAAFVVTPAGRTRFAALGIDVAAVAAQRRQFAPACMDWSERRDHIGGALGAALARRFETARWLRRRPDSRAVALTAAGGEALRAQFGWNPRAEDRAAPPAR
ncbi:ArsR/SmtB family transcription factor [Oleiharenicola sp. Vm1]|uniref:ArsR/SmtB family transcription factor n=1 Tax=Oleiharenicola sp. Vm1 TaxID=3398393 RepID=UPI0039F474A7